MLPEGKVKLVDFPLNDGEFKIVQIYLDETPYLVCGAYDDLHQELLKKFLISYEVNFDIIPAPGMPDFQVPALSDNKRYRVAGMGKSEIYYNIKYFQLPYHASHHYKICPDKEFNEMLKKMFIGWTF